MPSINAYTCTQSELETFHKIGATSSARIVTFRDGAIAGDFHTTDTYTDKDTDTNKETEKFTFNTQKAALEENLTHTIENSLELWHGISNNVVCATSKGSDQPAHTRNLIKAFASRLNIP